MTEGAVNRLATPSAKDRIVNALICCARFLMDSILADPNVATLLSIASLVVISLGLFFAIRRTSSIARRNRESSDIELVRARRDLVLLCEDAINEVRQIEDHSVQMLRRVDPDAQRPVVQQQIEDMRAWSRQVTSGISGIIETANAQGRTASDVERLMNYLTVKRVKMRDETMYGKSTTSQALLMVDEDETTLSMMPVPPEGEAPDPSTILRFTKGPGVKDQEAP